ncbi:MAG: D-glycero-beta-D-manno-heptose 1-phosphate adenylyltransferase [Desulfonauticus sp.]|jgi:rfaE bifunctional protein nucleotidyltransferase chain/domain|nr:MAG: RfaE bifunctional protein [Desulfonauticus sp. 38_4375]MDK2921110.1 D-glycero-beta-D-manno-heptose 1-phosphate adenylyltransferase [Desulfonauticus sp.]
MGKVVSKEEFLKLKEKFQGKRIVFTNGCFDILHPGHVDYLNRAKELGDILVVGLNSDASVRRLKGAKRPVNGEQDRAFVLSNLKAVDYVIIFEEDTPYELIQAIEPDFLVKGGDWPVEKIVGADIVLKKGGQVLSLEFLPGYSTTFLIEKILTLEKEKK